MSVSRIHELVLAGRISPAQGATLLEFRRQLAWKRKPWWERAGIVLLRMLGLV